MCDGNAFLDRLLRIFQLFLLLLLREWTKNHKNEKKIINIFVRVFFFVLLNENIDNRKWGESANMLWSWYLYKNSLMHHNSVTQSKKKNWERKRVLFEVKWNVFQHWEKEEDIKKKYWIKKFLSTYTWSKHTHYLKAFYYYFFRFHCSVCNVAKKKMNKKNCI